MSTTSVYYFEIVKVGVAPNRVGGSNYCFEESYLFSNRATGVPIRSASLFLAGLAAPN